MQNIRPNKMKTLKAYLNRKFQLIIAIGFFFTGHINAVTYTSIASGNWNNSAVWSPSGVPGASDNVIISSGNIININVASACSNFTISSGGTANFSAIVTCAVSGDLNVSGTITGSQTGSFTSLQLIIPSGSVAKIGRSNISVSDSLIISGSYLVTSTIGIKTFGKVKMNPGSDWTNNSSNNTIFTVATDMVICDGSIIKGTVSSSITVNGDLICEENSGYSDIGKCDLNVNGLVSVEGDLRFVQNSGTKNLNGGVTINPGGQVDNTAGQNLYINGNLTNNGEWNDGTTNVTYYFGGGSSLTISGNALKMSQINVLAGTTLTNLTHLSLKQNNGLNGSGSFYNGNGTSAAYLELGNANAIGISFFDFSSIDNIVEYNRAGTQTIEIPNASTYYHLIIEGSSSSKNLNANITVLGDVIIRSNLNANGNTITVKGNWTNEGTFTYATSTVIFNGTDDQTISTPYTPAGETFYRMTVNKASGNLVMSDPVTVTNSLTMTAGLIDAGTNTITLGTSTANTGTLSYTSGQIKGKLKRWISTTGTGILFPVGTDTYYRPALLTFTNLTNGALTIEFIESAPTNNGLPLTDVVTVYNTFSEGYWGLTATNSLASTNFNAELTGNGMSSFVILATTRLLKRDNSSLPWVANGTHVAASGLTVKRSTMNSVTCELALADLNNCTPPAPTSAIVGSTTVCTNQTNVTYSVTNTIGSTYAWTVVDGSIISGQGTNLITVNWGATGTTGNVEVVENNGCTNGSPVEMDVDIHALPTSDIFGYLSVAENTYGVPYSVTLRSGYTYTWSALSGTITSGQGTNSVTVDFGSAATESIICSASNGCGISAPVGLRVEIYPVITSVATGNWNVASTWDCNCIPQSTNSMRIDSGHVVTLVANTTTKNFIINQYGTLNNGSNILTVTADYINNGTHNGSQRIDLTGDETIIDGSGVINNSGELRIDGYSKYIFPTSTLNKTAGAVRIMNGLIVTNRGTFTLAGDLIGNNSTSKWINTTNSTLNAGGAVMVTGILNANATDNTVSYNGSINQTIKNAFSNTYYNLKADGGSDKILNGNLIILGDVEIAGIASLDVSAINYSLDINGSWSNTSTNANSFQEKSGIVSFSGTEPSQTITNTNGETYYNLKLNKTSGDLILNDNATVLNVLTLTDGPLDLNSNMLTISNSLSTAIVVTSGYIVSAQTDNSSKVKWNIASTTGAHTFPFGDTSGNYIPFMLNLTSGNIGNVTLSTYHTNFNNTPLPVTPDPVANVDANGFDNSANVVDRFWQIDKDGPSGIATLNFNATASEVGAISNLHEQR